MYNVIPVFPSTLLPAFIGQNLITTTESSAIQQSIKWFSASTLFHSIGYTELYRTSPVNSLAPCAQSHPQAHLWSDQIQGFPTFCKVTHHKCRIWFAHLLCIVHFLLLPSDTSVTRDALAIRINFPLIGVLSPSFRRPGLPALLGKQKWLPGNGQPFFYNDDINDCLIFLGSLRKSRTRKTTSSAEESILIFI